MRQRGPQLPWEPHRKLRTREHVLADLSYNFLEKKVLLRGHWLDAPRNDYGVDAIMFHHGPEGEVENGEVRFQLKATDRLDLHAEQGHIAQRVSARDLRYWYFESYPFILIVFDAARDRVFWLHVQSYLDQRPEFLESASELLTLHVPFRNRVTLRTIDMFRKLSLEVVAHDRGHRRGS
jgi:hypothetical protein